jgi:hypothetical protein
LVEIGPPVASARALFPNRSIKLTAANTHGIEATFCLFLREIGVQFLETGCSGFYTQDR